MKTLVVYYSRKGSNKYLAKRLASDLNADIEQIKPRINTFILLLLNIHLGIKKVEYDIKSYDQILLVGPIMLGRFLAPLKSFVKKYRKDISKLVFITCCGSTFEKKDEKFGHGLVFNEVQKIAGDICKHCEAFPILLVVPEDQKNNDEAMMNTRLNDSNFNGEILERYNRLITSIS